MRSAIDKRIMASADRRGRLEMGDGGDVRREEFLAELSMIQDVIKRMASNSFLLKGGH